MPPRPGPVGFGKEELRASVLRPYLLRLRAEKGEKAVRALVSTAGLPAAVLDNETAWISVAAARRGLTALAAALGKDGLASRGDYLTHPENLGTYVRLLRSAARPMDAYRQLCEHAQEATRVGTYELEELGPCKVRITYTPIDAEDPPERDALLSLAREAELRGLPRLWGLADADIAHEETTATGGPHSTYLVTWKPDSQHLRASLGAALGVLGGAAVGAVSGGLYAAVTSALVTGVLGGVLGVLLDHARTERAARVFERNRIAALERGLSLRGEAEQAKVAPGELDGTVLGGKYRILSRIGAGGIGVVYAAEHVTLGSTVAVKVLKGAAASDASEIARLRREARVQVSIEHPNVVRTLDLDQMPDGSLYVVMELLRGHSLAEEMLRDGAIAPGLAIPVFRRVCLGLHAAHEEGVVHRDMKPGNVFLCDDGEAKVLDFGMSKLTEAESLTQEGFTLGTPEYMAPEQCVGGEVEPRTDLYALGVLMYEALTGELPVNAKTRRELLDLQQRHIPIPMRVRRPDLPIPQALDDAVMMCLEKKIEARPADALALEAMLAAVPLEGLPVRYGPRRFSMEGV